jgi:hypothetical protein
LPADGVGMAVSAAVSAAADFRPSRRVTPGLGSLGRLSRYFARFASFALIRAGEDQLSGTKVQCGFTIVPGICSRGGCGPPSGWEPGPGPLPVSASSTVAAAGSWRRAGALGPRTLHDSPVLHGAGLLSAGGAAPGRFDRHGPRARASPNHHVNSYPSGKVDHRCRRSPAPDRRRSADPSHDSVSELPTQETSCAAAGPSCR